MFIDVDRNDHINDIAAENVNCTYKNLISFKSSERNRIVYLSVTRRKGRQ